MKTLQFNKYYVTDGVTKARVRYSPSYLTDGRFSITLYEKDYEDNLQKLFPYAQNDSDILTDYFENTRVRFFEGTPEFTELFAKLKQWGFAQ